MDYNSILNILSCSNYLAFTTGNFSILFCVSLKQNPIHIFLLFLKNYLFFLYFMTLQSYTFSVLSQIQPFLQRTLIFFTEEQYQKPMSKYWVCFLLLGCHCFQTLATDTEKKNMCAYQSLYIHILTNISMRNHLYLY